MLCRYDMSLCQPNTSAVVNVGPEVPCHYDMTLCTGAIVNVKPEVPCHYDVTLCQPNTRIVVNVRPEVWDQMLGGCANCCTHDCWDF